MLLPASETPFVVELYVAPPRTGVKVAVHVDLDVGAGEHDAADVAPFADDLAAAGDSALLGNQVLTSAGTTETCETIGPLPGSGSPR